MTDANGKSTGDVLTDLVSIEDGAELKSVAGPGASGQDSILNAAAMFEQQLEQMSAWKHQLAAQMEILRRDGIKILERQKQLAIEKRKLAEDRDSVSADRTLVVKLQGEVEAQRSNLEKRAAELASAKSELEKLAADKEKWLEELTSAQRGATEAKTARDAAAAQVEQAETRLSEIRVLEGQRDSLHASIAESQRALGDLEAQRVEIQEKQHALQLRDAELTAREHGLGEQEVKFLAMEITVREQTEQITLERRQLHDAQKQLGLQRDALAEQYADAQQKMNAAQRQLTLDRAEAQERLAQATTAMSSVQEAQASLAAHELDLAQRGQELSARDAILTSQAANCAAREQELLAAKNEVAAAQAALAVQTAALAEQERTILAARTNLDAEVAQRTAEAAALQSQLGEDRAALVRTRAEMQRRMDQAEVEHAEQLELLAKQTRRLSERRGELEAATTDLQKEIEQRVARASEAMKEELARAQHTYEQKISTLRRQLEEQEVSGSLWRLKEEEMRKHLSEAEWQAKMARDELSKLHNEMQGMSQARTELENQLSEQLRRFDRDAAEWQRKLELATAEKSVLQDQAAIAALAAARSEIDSLQQQITEVASARTELDRRLSERDAGHAEEIVRLRGEAEKILAQERARAEERVAELMIEAGALKNKAGRSDGASAEATELREKLSSAEKEWSTALAQRDAQIAEWRNQFEQVRRDLQTAQAAASTAVTTEVSLPADTRQLEELRRQLTQMEAQRNELATQLFAIQDSLQRREEEALLTRSSLEGQLLDLQEKTERLEAEKSRWTTPATAAHAVSTKAGNVLIDSARLGQNRERLLRQARSLRAYRKQMRESTGTLASGRDELVQQREQLRVRKENLEQVKRLLEKQEMVMARKLADHNALKTVAAVGIFVIMVLGSAFLSVYKFVAPNYRTEAVVQLVVPAGVTGQELSAWQSRQAEFVRNSEVTYAAWKILRGPDERYAMHDVRDEWLQSLVKNLTLQLDPQSKTLALRYSGPDSLGVSQVTNALAIAFSNPGMRESTDLTQSFGAGSTVLAKATPPMFAAEDYRLVIGLSVAAIVLFLSLIVVVIFRHYVARQLREIDQMADDSDLEDIRGEMPIDVRPA